MIKINEGKLILLSKHAVWDSKKMRFTKKQEASGLFSNLGLKTTFSKVPLSGDFLF